MPTFIRIALPVPLRRKYDYALAPEQPLPEVGGRVRVPFGSREMVGFVTANDISPAIDVNQVREVIAVSDAQALWPQPLWQLLLWAASYYHHPLGEVLVHAAPIAIKQGEPPSYTLVRRYQLSSQGEATEVTTLQRAKKQQQLFAALKRGAMSASSFREQGHSTAALKALQDKGLVEVHNCEPAFAPWHGEAHTQLQEQPHALNREQAVAVGAILGMVNTGKANVWLLEGVTGSGKTEVYLQVMAEVLAAGKQVLVLVPEIGLTPQTVARFRNRFQVPVVVLHSGLSDQERLQGWLQARDGHAGIVLGTRSAIFTPMQNLGLLILDEEHDSSFKQQDGFRYNARDLAIKRAHLEGFGVILGSATPSLESLANARSNRYAHLTLGKRAGAALPVKSGLIDLKSQRLHNGLSDQLLSVMQKHLDAGNQVLLFLNRRGFASALLCHECGWISDCHRCQANMTVHQQTNTLQCHHCGAQRRIPRQCQSCGSTQLITRGLGTEQLEQAIQTRFPNYPAIRIDRDSTRRKGQLEDYLEAVARGDYRILIGTQMLAKGHHFPDVTLVSLLDVDGALFSADFRAAERLAQLYVQVSGRAGRASKKGSVLLQTHHPDHPLIQELIQNGYKDFAQSALLEREQAMLPPYAAMALFRAEAMDKLAAEALLQVISDKLHAALDSEMPEVTVIGPMPAPLARRAGRFRYQLLLHAAARAPLHGLLQQCLPELENLAEARKARWTLDIDPQEFI
ncbi:primosomal protein N' [Aliidiomarina iranensis]|uniref:Replication restart protein PriA n=1 Tax=Aliidiomarina iranensis TaxID=1434071 RepID=A0A432VWY4_9GAMM|nr:primosomal protein N' [Aliidiomarina iranensis]RUO20971.1 primosomal protein N' [Aliidiomarina iranensis]